MDYFVHDPVENVCAFACARQGASHKMQDVAPSPCQDAYLISSGAVAGRSYVIAAVADGHGSPRHDRSHIGAMLASQTAVTVFQTLLVDNQEQDPDTLKLAFTDSFPAKVTQEWRKAVEKHLTHQGGAPRDYKRYGSTLLMAGIVDRLLFLAKLGDGDIVVTNRDQHQGEPLSVKGNLVAGETFSMCTEDAEKHFIALTMNLSDVAFVTLSTDGLRNSYESSDAFFRLLTGVQQNIEQYGLVRASSILPQHLDRFSTQGSGDDITLVGLRVGDPPECSTPEPSVVSSEPAVITTSDTDAEGAATAGKASAPPSLSPAPPPVSNSSPDTEPEPRTDAACPPTSGPLHARE